MGVIVLSIKNKILFIVSSFKSLERVTLSGFREGLAFFIVKNDIILFLLILDIPILQCSTLCALCVSTESMFLP